MTVQELFNKVSFKDIFVHFKPDVIESAMDANCIKDIYENAYREIKSTCQKNNEKFSTIIVVEVEDEFDVPKTHFDAFGYNTKTRSIHSIEFSPWSQILSCSVCPKSINDYSNIAVAAKIFFSMTLLGFDKNDIEKRKKEIADRLNAGIEACNKNHYITLEELERELYERFDIPKVREPNWDEVRKISKSNNNKKLEYMISTHEK